MSVPSVAPLPDIHANTPGFRDGARTLREESGRLQEHLTDAYTAWGGLRSAYHHEGTQEEVWAGLDVLDDPVDAWKDVLNRAATALEDLARKCDGVIFRYRSLEILRPGVETDRATALASQDPDTIAAATHRIEYFNDEVAELATEWATVQSDFAARIRGLTGGEEEDMPVVPGEAGTQRVDWASLGTAVAVGLKADDPAWVAAERKQIARDIAGLDAAGFRAWVRENRGSAAVFLGSGEYIQWLNANPGVAQGLVEHTFAEQPVKDSPEAALARFVNNPENFNPASNRADVRAVRTEWDRLSLEEQVYLLFTYPDIFGNMNGVPMEQRAQIGALNVRGHLAQVETDLEVRKHQDTWEERIPGYDDLHGGKWSHPKAYVPSYDDGNARRNAEEKWLLENVQLEQNQAGLRDGWFQYVDSGSASASSGRYRTVYVNPNGGGQTVTMQGSFGLGTEHVNTFIPGTYTTMASTARYNTALQTMTGGPRDDTVNFYWAGTDFPGSYDPHTGDQIGYSVATDNLTSHWSETGAPRLGAFDQATDLEEDTAVQTTIVHSAGAPLGGTAERTDNGMTTDKFLYLAPAGTGHNVGSPQDTVNPDADRAVIQTREDPIWVSQAFGGGFHGRNTFTGGDPSMRMNAARLESGLASGFPPQNPVRVGDGEAGGHSGLWEPGTTSRDNIEAFIYGGNLVPELPAEIDPMSPPQYPRMIDGLDAHPEITTNDDFIPYKKPYNEVIR